MTPIEIVFIVCAIFGLLVAIVAISLALRKKGQGGILPSASQTQSGGASPAAPSPSKRSFLFRSLFSKGVDLSNLEDELIMADVGAQKSHEIAEKLRSSLPQNADEAEIKEALCSYLVSTLSPVDRSLKIPSGKAAAVIMAGVNGSGKTTTAGKLAKYFKDRGRDVVLAACDTFRPAAGEQLEIWARKEEVGIVRGKEGQDPASVAFAASSTLTPSSLLIVDTAGRLQTKKNLLDELSKIKRVVEKNVEVAECLLVLDATFGQNALSQAKVFSQALPLTGIILTKLDGSCKGGVVLAVEDEFKVPVKMVGVGEGDSDLRPFDPEAFAKGLTQ
ncbi:MAG: signal recognition particle-docking protein FtsY [Aeriscardovia sp.]|nr:signal recognition particle-docking protein FtsY [Aeriscardovia sp.]